jgi:uncharacterized HhH-GPD family protein
MLHLSQDPAADQFLSEDPLALLIGMVLDQQVPLERAFRSPLDLRHRLGDRLEAAEIATTDASKLAEIFARPPALHRFPGSMARRVQELCQVLVTDYGGEAASVWEGVADGRDLLRRVRALPGFGDNKARIFVALLGKQLGVRPKGWRQAAGAFGAPGSRLSVADITDPESLAEVRAHKAAMKAEAKAAAASGRGGQ